MSEPTDQLLQTSAGGSCPLYLLLRTAESSSCLQQVLSTGHWAAMLQSNSWELHWCQATQKSPKEHTPVPWKTVQTGTYVGTKWLLRLRLGPGGEGDLK